MAKKKGGEEKDAILKHGWEKKQVENKKKKVEGVMRDYSR